MINFWMWESLYWSFLKTKQASFGVEQVSILLEHFDAFLFLYKSPHSHNFVKFSSSLGELT